MTYCVAMALDAGMIFASDSRTNAGVDHVSRYSKMRTFVEEGSRVIVTLSSGNLSVTQNALSLLEQRIRGGDSTMRSNISVGLPIDLCVYEHDALRVKLVRRVDEDDPYFQMVHNQWGEGLRRVFGQLPDPHWV
jgi:predicted proteasome-type protease